MAEAAENLENAPAQEEVTTEVPETAKPVGVNRFGIAVEKRNEFVVHCKHGTNPEHVLDVEFWEHLARHLGRGDIVEVVPDDLSWEMSVRVIDRGANWAHVKKRHFIDYGGAMEVASEIPQKYDVEWAGQTEKFRVLFNKEVLKSGFASESLARRYADNHAQALKR